MRRQREQQNKRRILIDGVTIHYYAPHWPVYSIETLGSEDCTNSNKQHETKSNPRIRPRNVSRCLHLVVDGREHPYHLIRQWVFELF